MQTNLIAYECIARDHQPSLIFPDKLTIHEGSWAFCAFDSHAAGHEWRSTGGAEFHEMLRRAGIALAQEGERPRVAQGQRAR